MASVQVSNLSELKRAQMAVTYASLICHDEQIEISQEKIQNIINAAEPQIEIDSYWIGVIGNLISNQIKDLIVPKQSCAAASSQEGQQQEAAAEKKEEKEEEAEDVDMGGMFGDDF